LYNATKLQVSIIKKIIFLTLPAEYATKTERTKHTDSNYQCTSKYIYQREQVLVTKMTLNNKVVVNLSHFTLTLQITNWHCRHTFTTVEWQLSCSLLC